jgi:hypothetical protein
MSDSTSDIKIPGERSKRFRVTWKGQLISSFDTLEELDPERRHYEDRISRLAGRGSTLADRKYEVWDRKELFRTGCAPEID